MTIDAIPSAHVMPAGARIGAGNRVAARRLVAILAFVAACNSQRTQIRTAAERGDVPRSLEMYREHVRERGASNPDALADMATAVIHRAAASSDPRERSAGFSALRSLGSRSRDALISLRMLPGVIGDRASAALYDLDGRFGSPPRRLFEAARSTDAERRVAGLTAFDPRRDASALISALDSEAPEVRRAAAQRLGRSIGVAAAAGALAQRALRDPDDMVRSACVSALGPHGNVAVAILERALEDPEMMVRMTAVSALAQASPVRAAAVLVPMLAQEPTPLRLEIARVMAQRGDPLAVTYILDALDDARSDIRAQAAVGATALREAHFAELVPHIEDADFEVRIRVGAALSRRPEYRDRVIRALRPLAQRPDPAIAIRALGVLAEAGDPTSAEPLRGALHAPDATVRRLAIIAWSNLAGTSGEADPLAPLLADSDRSVRLMAAAEIVRIASR